MSDRMHETIGKTKRTDLNWVKEGGEAFLMKVANCEVM
jgi:hypothetical protein